MTAPIVPAVPPEPCRPALALIRRVGRGETAMMPPDGEGKKRDAFRVVVKIGAGIVDPEGRLRLVRSDLAPNGEINPLVLRELLEALPGGAAGIGLLVRKPGASPDEVGETIRAAVGAQWGLATLLSVGTNWRAWARAAGITLTRVPRGTAAGWVAYDP